MSEEKDILKDDMISDAESSGVPGSVSADAPVVDANGVDAHGVEIVDAPSCDAAVVADAGSADAELDADAPKGKYGALTSESGGRYKLTGMYKDWFLDYASYVILERAVPHVEDGLKPVQRRILHSMKRLDDGRYNKVANVIGHTMQFHPHGDASIGDALVQLGQKDILIDCQGKFSRATRLPPRDI